VNGVINCLKPPGMTSHDVVDFIRKQLGTKKVGHGGTLDPGAAGVLPIFVGKATKAVEFFDDCDKEYVAEMTLGVTTDTGDNLGKVLEIRECEAEPASIVETFGKFVGKIQQIPPMYSAVRHKGKKLYELARQGITVERKPRTVEIYSIELIKYEKPRVLFKVSCSRGTYIRTLCEDIGRALGCGAHLSCLIRTKLGPFNISRAITLEEIKEKSPDILVPLEEILSAFMASATIQVRNEKSFFKGAEFPAENLSDEPDENRRVIIYDQNKRFIGVGRIFNLNANPTVKVEKSFL